MKLWIADGNLAGYFDEFDKIGMWPFRPCQRCGANVDANHLLLHVTWHETQKSTERLILDNQPATADRVAALIEEAEQRHGTSMYCKVTTYELRKALGQDVTGWPNDRISP